jgi:hypothetical protein
MRVFKRSSATETIPYLDNCYIADVVENIGDVDVTCVFGLKEFFRVGQIDYLQYRKYLKDYLLPDWANLPLEDKVEMVNHNVAPTQEDKDALVSQEQQLMNYVTIVEREVKSRQARWDVSMAKAAFYLFGNDLGRLMMYNDAKVFRNDYIEADLPHLILWLTDGTYPALGIDFTNTGFGSKPYYSEVIKSTCLEILTK